MFLQWTSPVTTFAEVACVEHLADERVVVIGCGEVVLVVVWVHWVS